MDQNKEPHTRAVDNRINHRTKGICASTLLESESNFTIWVVKYSGLSVKILKSMGNLILWSFKIVYIMKPSCYKASLKGISTYLQCAYFTTTADDCRNYLTLRGSKSTFRNGLTERLATILRMFHYLRRAK